VKEQGSWRELARGEKGRGFASFSGGRGSENKRCGAAWVAGGEWSSCLPLLSSLSLLRVTPLSRPFRFLLFSRTLRQRKNAHMNQASDLLVGSAKKP
jgi:hypothetical protein